MRPNLIDNVKAQINGSINAKLAVLEFLPIIIANTGAILSSTLKQGHKILICGNGGSAADAQHFSAELLVRYVN